MPVLERIHRSSQRVPRGELVSFVQRLRAGGIVSAGVSATLVDLLRLNTDLAMVASTLGLDPLAHGSEDLGLRLFNMTGTQVGTRADVGCVESGGAGERRVAFYAVIARFDDAATTRRAVLGAMRAVGESVVTAAAVRIA
jgi:beta-lactamase class A